MASTANVPPFLARIKDVYQITFPNWRTGIDVDKWDLPWAARVKFEHHAGFWKHAMIRWNPNAEAHWLYIGKQNVTSTFPEWEQWVVESDGVIAKLKEYPHLTRGRLSAEEKRYIETGER